MLRLSITLRGCVSPVQRTLFTRGVHTRCLASIIIAITIIVIAVVGVVVNVKVVVALETSIEVILAQVESGPHGRRQLKCVVYRSPANNVCVCVCEFDDS